MRATFCLFLLTTSSVMLMGRTSYATLADDTKHLENTKTSDQQSGHRHASEKNQAHRPAQPSKANRPKQLSNDHGRSTTGTVRNASQSILNRSNGAANDASIESQAVSKARPVQSPPVARPSAPAPNNTRHRSPNPATVGGPKGLTAANTGAIDGTRMPRKP